MFGLYIGVTCPHCHKSYTEDLGSSVRYYSVNNSKEDYVKLCCDLCNKKFWMSHEGAKCINTIKCDGKDKVEFKTMFCW